MIDLTMHIINCVYASSINDYLSNRAYPAVLCTQVSDITHSWIGYNLSAADE